MEQAQQRVLHQYDDRSLWYAEAEDRSWRLPLFVEYRVDREADTHYCHIVPAVCLYYSQALALKALLEPHDIQGRDGQWIVTRRMCEAILHKAPGITPAFYYKWNEPDCPLIENKPPLRTKLGKAGPRPQDKAISNDPLRRSFVEWLAKERKLPSSIINAVLTAIADEGPVWMLRYRKPLDLGFVRLVALPFRANWKEIVAFKAKARGIRLRSLFSLPKDEVDEALEECGLPAMMTSPHNIGLRHGWTGEADSRIDYCIEAIATEKFENTANRIEGERASRGPAAYVAEFEGAVEAVYTHAMQALRAYLKKVAAPFAQLGSGRKPGFFGFLPVRGRRLEVRGTPLDRLPVYLVGSDTRFSVLGGESDPRLLPAPPAEVQEMPIAVPAIDDMRQREINGDFHLVGGEENSARLPVQHGGQIENGGS